MKRRLKYHGHVNRMSAERYPQIALYEEIDRRIMKRRLKYYGHVNRMSAERYPKIALYGYVHGNRNEERPKMRWLTNVKVDCEEMGLNL